MALNRVIQQIKDLLAKFPVSIANGGTGATTPAKALNNLGVTYGTTDLTPGTSSLTTGAIYIVYE